MGLVEINLRRKFMYIDKATISKYTSYFHDGSLLNIQYGKTPVDLTLSMESCYIDEEDLKDPIPRSSEDTLRGKLHLKGIKNIYIDNEVLSTPLKMNYDDGEIFRLDIKDNEIQMHIIWNNYPPKNRVNDCSTITINVEDVYWENIPDMN
jgi:hypothetical protein